MFNNNTKVYKYTKTRRSENNNNNDNNNNNNNKQNTSWKGNKENLKMLFTCDCLQSLQAAGVGIKYCSTDPCLCCSNVIRSLPYLHVSTRRYEFNSGSSQMSLTYS